MLPSLIYKMFVNLFISLTIFLLLVDSHLTSAALNPDCKNYIKDKYDSFACVCTETQPCAKVETPVRTPASVVTKWESGRDGARLRKTTLHVGLNDRQTNAAAQLHIRVNRDVKYQEIFGFGGAFTDSAAINIKKVGDKLGTQIMNDYFSHDGLEYNVGRIPIGGSDFSPRAYSLDDSTEDKDLHNWNLQQEDLDYKVITIRHINL
jgi:glucosylceramidase